MAYDKKSLPASAHELKASLDRFRVYKAPEEPDEDVFRIMKEVLVWYATATDAEMSIDGGELAQLTLDKLKDL